MDFYLMQGCIFFKVASYNPRRKKQNACRIGYLQPILTMLKALLVECGIDNGLLENELSRNGIDFLKVRHSPYFITFVKVS